MRLRGVVRLRGVTCACACACAGAVAWSAGAALADGNNPNFPDSVLHVMAGGPLTPGSVLTITATGSNVPLQVDGSGFPYGLDLFLVSADLLPGPCATDENAELTISANNTQAVDFLTFRELDEGVPTVNAPQMPYPFTISTPVTLNNGTGHILICAYSTYGSLDTAAWASTEVTIAPAPGHAIGPGKPGVVRRPRVTRSEGRLLCSRGSWSQSPTTYRYRWLVLHKAGTAGRGPSLTLSRMVRGRTVECSVTASNSAGRTTATSRPFPVA